MKLQGLLLLSPNFKIVSVVSKSFSILFHLLLLLILSTIMTTTTTMGLSMASSSLLPKPIVYTIAGSDSGGGAGIQADLNAIHSLNCHGCSAITCLTAQNSVGVTAVHSPPPEFLEKQLDALFDDLPPRAIKVGMLGSKTLSVEVGKFLKKVKSSSLSSSNHEQEPPFVVVDPVMISTSGHRLIDEDAQQSMIDNVFPYADLVTPNKYEAEALLGGRKLICPEDVERGAQEILDMGANAVLIKGGHSLEEGATLSSSLDSNATIGYAQDYFLSKGDDTDRLCDGPRGVWLRTDRFDTPNTHGTGCTLSSAIASALAIGHQQREISTGSGSTGAARAILPIDACCIGKAYVTAGIACAVQYGKGPGPVAHTKFPSSHRHFPTVAFSPKVLSSAVAPFIPMNRADTSSSSSPTGDEEQIPTLGKILPIVETSEWVTRLSKIKGITDIQLRIKDPSILANPAKILSCIMESQTACTANRVRLWINDHWEPAIQAKCFGVHLGQEDLASCLDRGGIDRMKEHNLALGISTHSYAELAVALGVKPSYISLGPVFGTTSKNVAFDPQGLHTVQKWRELIDPDVPLVVIGGINDADRARQMKDAGADCVAVISAITKSNDVDKAVLELSNAMESS